MKNNVMRDMESKGTQINVFRVNTFLKIAEKYRMYVTDEKEILNENMTKTFYRELDLMIKNKELININVNGVVRTGKSTMAIALGKYIHDLMKKNGRISKNSNYGMYNIARDQQEFSKKMRDPNLNNNIIVTDEFNDLETGGQNSSAETQLADTYSNVQAARYVHRITCSPKDLPDTNASILLEVVSADRTKKLTHCKLFYRYFYGGSTHNQLIGYVNIYVGSIIEKWDEIVDVFLKHNKTKKELEMIEKYKKEDMFVEYNVKKHEKMELINEHGIFRPRMLQYAELIMNVVNKLKPLTKVKGMYKPLIRNYIKLETKRLKIPTSIIGDRLFEEEIDGILSCYQQLYILIDNIDKLNMLIEKRKIDEVKGKEKLLVLEEAKKEIAIAINIQESENKLMQKIQKEYETMEN